MVPLSFHLSGQNRILLISGPNAGGKSVCLKTIGLVQYMLQCGLLVPAGHESVFGLFAGIFIDIGDEQSLENDLSTYSSHLINIREFIRHANRNSLFLIDEFGTGSDPELGGALAEVFLEEFYENGAFGIITTHYSNLKVLANELENATNVNMQFD